MEATAAELAARLGIAVELVSTRAAALRLLDRRTYEVVIFDQMLADADPESAELVWQRTGLAMPIQISFALAGTLRLEREIRSALGRRLREQQLAVAAAAATMDMDVKNAITGLLLESQLALAEEGIPPAVASRLRTVLGIADRLRNRLGMEPKNHSTARALQGNTGTT
jgi:hypothetical protein